VKRRGLLALGVLSAMPLPSALAETLVTEVVPVGYRSAAELLPVLRPLVPTPGSINAFQNQLVIRTTPDNLQEIRAVLATLDSPPANLLVTVKRSLDESIRRDLAAARVRVGAGDAVVTLGGGARAGLGSGARGADGASASVRVERGVTTRRDGDVQTLRVLEGREAYIHGGESVPVGERAVVIGGGGVSVVEGVRYESFGSGFAVRPELRGDQVTLHITPGRRERRGDGSAAVQEASTVISARLGEWMQIGGFDASGARTSRDIGASSSITTRREDALYVKVDRLD